MLNVPITKILLVLTVVLCVPLSGCGNNTPKAEVVASVGEARITIVDFNERIANLPDRYQDIVKKRKGEFLEDLINDTLLYQEAIKEGFHKDEDVKKVIQEARKKILIARLLKDKVDDTISISEEDIQVFYDKNKEKYKTPEIMRASHILVPKRETAELILSEINEGTSFEDMARAKSVDPTAQRAGDIGYFPKGQLMPDFEKACSVLEVNEISGVVKTKLGYHIIKLTDRKAPQVVPLDRVRDKIRQEIRTAERQRVFNELLDRLRKETDIEINQEALSKAGQEESVEESTETMTESKADANKEATDDQ